MDGKEYLKMLAEELASEFMAIGRLPKFVRNSAIIGAHAEAAVRHFVRRTVAPLRVSTGAIIFEGNTGTKGNGELSQLDTMIWSPVFGPALFERGKFALVTRGNCHVALEIKCSAYPGSGVAARNILCKEDSLFQWWAKENNGGDHKTMELQRGPDGALPNMVAVFCTEGAMREEERCLLMETKNGGRRALLLLKGKNHSPNHQDILEFVNVLLRARWLGMQTSIFQTINTQLLKDSAKAPESRRRSDAAE